MQPSTIFALSPPGTTSSWIDAMLLFLHIPPTALSSICLSRKSSDLFRRTCHLCLSQPEWSFFSHVAAVLGTRWQSCMRTATASTHASLSLPFASLSRRTRQFPPTICTASPDSVRLANAATLRSVQDQKCKNSSPFFFFLFNMQRFIWSVGSNVATGGRGTSIPLGFQMPPLCPQCPSSPRMTKVTL